jgi:predicted nucleotide-binding protein (sugar kinase/HSP70/actin superfamily)
VENCIKLSVVACRFRNFSRSFDARNRSKFTRYIVYSTHYETRWIKNNFVPHTKAFLAIRLLMYTQKRVVKAIQKVEGWKN